MLSFLLEYCNSGYSLLKFLLRYNLKGATTYMQKITKFGYSFVAALAILFAAVGIPLVSYADDTAMSIEEIQDFSIDAKAAEYPLLQYSKRKLSI